MVLNNSTTGSTDKSYRSLENLIAKARDEKSELGKEISENEINQILNNPLLNSVPDGLSPQDIWSLGTTQFFDQASLRPEESKRAVATLRQRAVSELSRIQKDKDVTFLGESAHGYAQPIQALTALVRSNPMSIDYIGVEGEPNAKPRDIEMNADTPCLLRHGGNKAEVMEAWRGLMQAIIDANTIRQKQGKAPIYGAVIDLPQPLPDPKNPKNIQPFVDWFLERDAHMYGLLKEKTQKCEQGVVLLGAAHASLSPFPLPGPLSQVGGVVEPVGLRLRRDTSISSVSIWMDQEFLEEDRQAYVTEQWRPVFDVQQHMPKSPGYWLPAGSILLRNAIKAAGAEQGPVNLSEDYDYYWKLSGLF